MAINTKVKFNDKGQIFVNVPYKNGEVTWGLSFNPNGKTDWILYDKPEQYNPDRVANDHKSILAGKKLRHKMIKKAAAKHSYSVLQKLKAIKY